MIPNFKMGCYHQKDYIRPCQISDKIKKPMGFEYSSLISTKTYSILSYIVGGFVGSKSQMNNDKNLSYDLSTVIFNLLNPQKTAKRPKDNIYCSKFNYDKYYQKSSFKEQAVDLELGIIGALSLLEQNMFSFNDYCDKLSVSQRKMKVADPDVTDRAASQTINLNSMVERSRQQSESSVESTDSESFIVFDYQDDEMKDKKADVEFGGEDDDRDDDDDDDNYDDDDDCSCDEYDIFSVDKELAEANEKWSKNYEDVAQDDEISRRVRFSDDVKINKMVAWDYAYRAARPGPWEQMARDRVRFQERICRLSPVICPVLERRHREKIYKRFCS